ncbi:rap guanine nucleotide exchange factor 1-like protein [Dinothrombium tinctorium]|uniref:CRK SH3-binding GNRP n=1 Tax=Dinothrombium tinctorium TaxID=1965070 RepID=A0A443RMT2_9ACAR|nr:rap guanine nucleotide exchange factor 1-like protein [Dinothrombium tinctorium]RWS13953.1 rap guanine nucleotide exchange factor 1-like protein [Dinothrombium tinctorium]RWS16557.1 rap guanine nucleotide exchange factor 1-like protein [Dinothrombium tinctorium]
MSSGDSSSNRSSIHTLEQENEANGETKATEDCVRQHHAGARFARRAKSFKDEFFDKINQKIRSPSLTRSSSPPTRRQRKMKAKKCHGYESGASDGSLNDSPKVQRSLLDCNVKSKEERDIDNAWNFVRQISNALRYLKDVVEKDKLEQLPGAASIMLEIVLSGYAELQAYLIRNEQSSLLMSATNQVYNSLANLIKWSDSVLLYDHSALDRESVGVVVDNVIESVKGLVQLCVDRHLNSTLNLPKTEKGENVRDSGHSSGFNVQIFPPDVTPSELHNNHRNSFPESPTTPKISKASYNHYSDDIDSLHRRHRVSHDKVSHSLSSDSILNSSVDATYAFPPPKPPLLINNSFLGKKLELDCISNDAPPPLPPKRGSGTSHNRSQVSQPSVESSLCTSESSSIDSHMNITHSYCRHSAGDLLSITNYDKPCFDLLTEFPPNSSREERCCLSEQFSKTFSYSNDVGRYSSSSTPSSTAQVNTSRQDISEQFRCINIDSDQSSPPEVPVKLRNKPPKIINNQNINRPPSQYDNLPDILTPCQSTASFASSNSSENNLSFISSSGQMANSHSLSCPDYLRNHANNGDRDKVDDENKPPPLPPKKRSIMTYIHVVGTYCGPNDAALNLYRHSVHTYHLVNHQNQPQAWQQVELSFSRQKALTKSFISTTTTESGDSLLSIESGSDSSQMTDSGTKSNVVPPKLPPKTKVTPRVQEVHNLLTSHNSLPPKTNSPPQNIRRKSSTNLDVKIEELQQLGPLDKVDVTPYLVFKNPGDDGPEVRGGPVDALVVKATEVSKNDFLFQEAFITTYRTILTPQELIDKLLYRYNKFIHVSDKRQRAAKNAFALLVRVVNDLSISDCSDVVMNTLLEFIYQLVARGDLALARVLRSEVIEKFELKRNAANATPILLPSMAITMKQSSCLDFKSETIAEQMTLLDAELFKKIEVAEVLLWTREQKEELIPNLNKFTEHFNKMSYWARTRVLELEDAKDREKIMLKFIKVMKHLKKVNNYNSYLALLSALDSAPIRRLEWQRNITEAMKEYSTLIDSSSSFRAYRQALAETQPPCIPYIGLILQDLTFVHIGNNDYLNDGSINFAKRWQIFNILDQMRRFRDSHYPFKRNEQVISYFGDFENYINEEAIWQISETIKPRGSGYSK